MSGIKKLRIRRIIPSMEESASIPKAVIKDEIRMLPRLVLFVDITRRILSLIISNTIIFRVHLQIFTIDTFYEIIQSMKDRNKIKTNLMNILSVIVLLLGIFTVVYYIFTRERVDFNIDFTDSLLWAAASVESNSLINPDFWYAYIIPFSGSLLMIPLVKILGVTYLAHELGMTVFALVFTVSILFGGRAVGLTYRKSSFMTGLLLLILTSSSTTRMIFFGHIIHYSLAMVFTSIAFILLNRLDCLYADRFSLKQKIYYAILLIWTCLCCLNGSSALALFFCPVAGALVMERLLDRDEIIISKIRMPIIRLIGMAGAALLGFLIKRYRIQPYFDNSYEESFSALLGHEEWFWKEQGFFVRFSTLLTGSVYKGTPMLSMDGIFILLRLTLAALLLVIPVLALFFYKRCNSRMMRILLLDYWILFLITQLTYSVAKIQEANWRLGALLGMSIIVSLVYSFWILKEKFFCRFGYLILALFIVSACSAVVTVIQLPTDTGINGYERLAGVLDEHGLTYGYTDLWGGANAITVMTDSRIRVRAIHFENGEYSIERYQSQASWYEDQPGQDRYFVVISNDIIPEFDGALVRYAVEKIPFEESTILVFDKNIFENGKPAFRADGT